MATTQKMFAALALRTTFTLLHASGCLNDEGDVGVVLAVEGELRLSADANPCVKGVDTGRQSQAIENAGLEIYVAVGGDCGGQISRVCSV
jgi:hypothetical protein